MRLKWRRWELENLLDWVEEHEKRGTTWLEREKAWREDYGTPRSAPAIRAQHIRLKHHWFPKCMINRIPSSTHSIQIPEMPTASPRKQKRLRMKARFEQTQTPEEIPIESVRLSQVSTTQSLSTRSRSPADNVDKELQQDEGKVCPSNYDARLESCLRLCRLF